MTNASKPGASKPWENENAPSATPPIPTPTAPPAPPAPATDDLDALKAKADELGVQYAANIGAETLAGRIAEAEAEAAKATAETDADKGEPTVVTPPADINAKLSEEKVSTGTRKVDPKSLDFTQQAPLEVINMVSQGKTVKEAMKIYNKTRAAKTVQAEAEAVVEDAEE